MKKYFVIIITALVLGGCENHKSEMVKATSERDSLLAVANSKDAVINDFLTSFNEIQDNLIAITQKENLVASSAAGSEVNKPTKEKIKDEIATINNLMDKNKKAIADLSKKLKGASGKTAHLEKMLADLNQQMDQKNKELTDLNDKVASLNTTVETLNSNVTYLNGQNDAKEKTIEDQTKTMHTAYYTIGTSKMLTEEKVVDKEGGILGIGAAPVLDPNFNQKVFTAVDITQTNVIPVNSKDARLVTTHPADSYKFQVEDNKVTSLVITDPDKFWKASKYLVVLTN